MQDEIKIPGSLCIMNKKIWYLVFQSIYEKSYTAIKLLKPEEEYT